MTINFTRVSELLKKAAATVSTFALVASSFAGVLVMPATVMAAAPVQKFSASTAPTTVTAPGTQAFTVTFTNDSTSTDDIKAGRVTLPTGFTLQTPPTPSLSGVTGWEVCSTGSEIQFGNIGNGAGVAPGTSMSVTFTASVAASAGPHTFTARAFKNSSCNPGTGAEFDSNQTPIIVVVPPPVTTFTLNYVAGANGTLTGSTTQVVNSGANGTAVTAVANANFLFVNWTPGGSTSASRTDTNAAASATYTANFAAVPPTNNAPVASSFSIVTSTGVATSSTLLAIDIDLNALTFSIVTGPLNGLISSLNLVSGAFTYTPSPAYIGLDSFTFKVYDGTVYSNTATTSVTVNAIPSTNSAPVANPLSISTFKNVATSSAATATDANPGDTLIYATSTNPTNGALVFNTNGTFTYTPTSGYVGADSFTFVAYDGTINSAPATVSITVSAAPVVPACSDGINNDSDSLIDAADPGCSTNGVYDPNDTDETDVVIQPTGSDVAISKTIDDSTPDNGQQIVYAIKVANAGPQAATNVVVTDVLPSGVTYVSDNSGGTYATSTGLWTVGTLAASASTTLQITVTASASAGQTVTNTASADADGTDNRPADDTGSVAFTVNTPVTPPVTPPSNGGGGGGGGGSSNRRSGTVLGASTGGEVLGVACGLYMDSYMKRGGRNSEVQVIKLQAFLNTQGLFNRIPTAVYDQRTENAVKDFQQKYTEQILKPWGITAPTGLVYLTTLRQINMIQCPALMIPVPTLIDWNKNPAVK